MISGQLFVARGGQICIYLVVEALLIALSYPDVANDIIHNACPGSNRQITLETGNYVLTEIKEAQEAPVVSCE
jgi:hypothetical protein